MASVATTARRSGLLVPVAEAEPVVGELRRAHDPVANLGIPAHVTVLFPFAPAVEVDDALQAGLRELFGGLPAFSYRFAQVARFGETTVYLQPDPSVAFSALTQAVAGRWPMYPPYEGAFDVVIPHLTVGDQLPPGAAAPLADAAASALNRSGPITGRCREVLLMTEGADGRWSTVGRYPLADPP